MQIYVYVANSWKTNLYHVYSGKMVLLDFLTVNLLSDKEPVQTIL